MQVALIGSGYWGSRVRKYIPEFFDLKYIADSKFDLLTIWSDREVEAVLIMTPMDTHYDIAVQALLCGKHVFVAKPLALNYEDALSLRNLAICMEREIGVDYTQTFSPTIVKIKELIHKIGDIEYIEMSTKHLGRFFKEYDVYWLLAAHHLSILDMFIDLNSLSFEFKDHIINKNVCTTGSIIFSKGRIDVSTNFPGKEFLINIYGSNGTIKYDVTIQKCLGVTLYGKTYKKLPSELITEDISYVSDEQNNIRYAIKYFRDLIDGKEKSNVDVALKVTKILEDRR